MAIHFDPNIPIYQQIIEYIKRSLANNEYPPGSKMPAVRELALELGVNPNTVQKALAEMERLGYLYSERTAGRFVTEDIELIKALKQEIPEKIIARFIVDMTVLGIKPGDILNLTDQYLKKYVQGVDSK